MLQQEAAKSFAVGHLSLGYVLGKATAKLAGTEMNLPLVFTLSVLPDIDLVIPYLQHRGPTHSVLVAIALFVPAFAVWGRRALPYFAAFLQHSLIGDYVGGGELQLLWPLTRETYGLGIDLRSATSITIELLAFLAAVFVLLKTRDVAKLTRSQGTNLLLLIPLPTLIDLPLTLVPVLGIPHAVFLVLFLMSILAYMRRPPTEDGQSHE